MTDHAFKAFYRRVKAGQKPGFPRFQSAQRFDSMETSANNGARLRRQSPTQAPLQEGER